MQKGSEEAVKTSGAQTPVQEKEVLISAIETSVVCHKWTDIIYESLLIWISEEELDNRYEFSQGAISSQL